MWGGECGHNSNPKSMRYFGIRLCTLVLSLAVTSPPLSAATFTVSSTNDSGPGTLRQAILDANAAGDLDTIQFLLPGVPPFTIAPASALPPLAAPVFIDGTTQPGFTSSPIVELNGVSAGAGTVGLRITGGGCTIRGLAINRFAADGIRLDSGNNFIRGNYIGTDITGTLARGNGQNGVFVQSTSTNVIGGTNVADRNVISGRNDTGIYVLNGMANVIQGNYIGVNAAGNAGLSNVNNGIAIYNAPANVVGGATAGARNVIGGNGGSGINLNLGAATGNLIQGNYIGVNAAGTAALANNADGITLNNAPANFIGGTNPGSRNLISGNGQSGIFLAGLGARDNLIAGNFIGTDASGAGAVGNSLAGVTLLNSVSNLIGNSLPGSRNVISGNRQAGILLSTNALGNQVLNNFIGLAANGTNALGNAFDGVALQHARFNRIGSSGAGNVISGNASNGIVVLGVGASNNFVQANHIGTDLSGNAAVRNVGSGVWLESAGNQIGGSLPGDGNLISGNGFLGVWLLNSNAFGNFIRGNLIGTTVAGTSGLGNAFGGVGLSDAPSNQIGGWTAAERNLISANGFPANNGGIFLIGDRSRGNRFCGNFIGTDITGQIALPNRYEGIYVTGANSNHIGSDLPGGGNLISGNTTRGIRLTNSAGNLVHGNLIGTTSDGVSALGNGQFNIEFEANCRSNSVGGLSVGAGNRIAFTGTYAGGPFSGVRVRDGATNNLILGNAIFNNSSLGIDLGTFGVSANDHCDSDSGGNMLQNFPVLTSASSGDFTKILGTLNSSPNTLFRIQFFSSPACDNSGNGEGQSYLGDLLVTTDGACSSSFLAILPIAVSPGHAVTATATDPANNTSEFSACAIIQALPPSPRLAISFPSNLVSFTWTNTATGFVLKTTSSLSAPVQWTTVTNAAVQSNGQYVVTMPRPPGDRFYRLSLE